MCAQVTDLRIAFCKLSLAVHNLAWLMDIEMTKVDDLHLILALALRFGCLIDVAYSAIIMV